MEPKGNEGQGKLARKGSYDQSLLYFTAQTQLPSLNRLRITYYLFEGQDLEHCLQSRSQSSSGIPAESMELGLEMLCLLLYSRSLYLPDNQLPFFSAQRVSVGPHC